MEIMFNNVVITNLIHVTEVNKNPYPTRKINSIEVPNRNGVYFQGAYFGEREITVDFHLLEDYVAIDGNDSRFNTVVRSLMYYLTTDAPAKLIFSDEPTKFYWAIVESVDLTRLFQLGEGTINFKCLDCFAYATELKTYQVDSGVLTVYNYGTAPTYPTFNIVFSKAVKCFVIYTRDQIIQIGNTDTIEKTTTATNPKIHGDGMHDMSKWYYGSAQLLQSGDTSGRAYDDTIVFENTNQLMKPSNLSKYEDNAGTDIYKGGFMLTNLDQTVEYYKFVGQFYMSSRGSFSATSSKQYAEQMGMIEMIGYDTNNVVLFRLSMRDHWKTMVHNEPFWYLGNSNANLIWKAGGGSAKATTKTYTKVITNDDQIPTTATVLSDIDTPTYKLTTTVSCAVYSSASTKSTVITTVPKGTVFTMKSSKTGWYCVYLTEDLTQVGWIGNKTCTKEEGDSIRKVTYQITTYGTSNGKYNDWWGKFELSRIPVTEGSLWHLAIKRLDFDTSKQTLVFEKYVSDPTNQYVQGNGQLAKVGVFIGCYEDGAPVGRMSFNELHVYDISNQTNVEAVPYIAYAGDEIEINCEEHMIYRNGEEFMEYVDVGSEFVELQPFTSTEVAYVCEDEDIQITATVQERFI